MKERIARIFVCLLGVGFITWTVYYKWSGLSSNPNFLGPGSLAGIGLGVVLIGIALFTRVFCFFVAVWSIVGGGNSFCVGQCPLLVKPLSAIEPDSGDDCGCAKQIPFLKSSKNCFGERWQSEVWETRCCSRIFRFSVDC